MVSPVPTEGRLTPDFVPDSIEGQVHRLQLIKRQMYGRTGFALLHRRVLPFTTHKEHRASRASLNLRKSPSSVAKRT